MRSPSTSSNPPSGYGSYHHSEQSFERRYSTSESSDSWHGSSAYFTAPLTSNPRQKTTQMEIDSLCWEDQAIYCDRLESLRRRHPNSNSDNTKFWNNTGFRNLEGIQNLYNNYTHEDACRFLAWLEVSAKNSEDVTSSESSELSDVTTTVSQIQGHYGLYRVIDKPSDSLIAMACHPTLKEFEFIEINPNFKIQIFPGDYVAVKGLKANSNYRNPGNQFLQYYRKIQSHCEMSATIWKLLERNLKFDQIALKYQEGLAVRKGHPEPVQAPKGMEQGVVYRVTVVYFESFGGQTILPFLPRILSYEPVEPCSLSPEDLPILQCTMLQIPRDQKSHNYFFTAPHPSRDGNLLIFQKKFRLDWPAGTRILVSYQDGDVEAQIEENEEFEFRARIQKYSRHNMDLDRKFRVLVQQIALKTPEIYLEPGFLTRLPKVSNGSYILHKLLGLGQPEKPKKPENQPMPGLKFALHPLNRCHLAYNNRLIFERDPLLVLAGPEMTQPEKALICGAYHLAGNRPGIQLVVTGLNGLKGLKDLPQEEALSAFRYPEDFSDLLTESLIQTVQWPDFKLHTEFQAIQAGKYLIRHGLYSYEDMHWAIQDLLDDSGDIRAIEDDSPFWLDLYVELAEPKPNIIVASVEKVHEVWKVIRENVVSVHCYEVERAALVSLVAKFPWAQFAVFEQGKPETGMQEKTGMPEKCGMPRTSLGQIDQLAHFNSPLPTIFPTCRLRQIYNCHPTLAHLFGLFTTDHAPNDLLKIRTGIFPDPNFPLLIIDNKNTTPEKMSKIQRNIQEDQILELLIPGILNGDENNLEKIDPEEISVICLEKNRVEDIQISLKMTPKIKVGILADFQNSRSEISIICCSNYKESAFEMVQESLLKYLSIGKQVTILIGNMEEMRKVEKWNVLPEIYPYSAYSILMSTTVFPQSSPCFMPNLWMAFLNRCCNVLATVIRSQLQYSPLDPLFHVKSVNDLPYLLLQFILVFTYFCLNSIHSVTDLPRTLQYCPPYPALTTVSHLDPNTVFYDSFQFVKDLLPINPFWTRLQTTVFTNSLFIHISTNSIRYTPQKVTLQRFFEECIL